MAISLYNLDALHGLYFLSCFYRDRIHHRDEEVVLSKAWSATWVFIYCQHMKTWTKKIHLKAAGQVSVTHINDFISLHMYFPVS